MHKLTCSQQPTIINNICMCNINNSTAMAAPTLFVLFLLFLLPSRPGVRPGVVQVEGGTLLSGARPNTLANHLPKLMVVAAGALSGSEMAGDQALQL